MTLTAPSHLIALTRKSPARLRVERTAWIDARRCEGATYDQIAAALGLGADHARAMSLAAGGDLLERCEREAEQLLEGPLRRRNWTVETRDAVARSLQAFARREGVKA